MPNLPANTFLDPFPIPDTLTGKRALASRIRAFEEAMQTCLAGARVSEDKAERDKMLRGADEYAQWYDLFRSYFAHMQSG